MKNVFLFTIGFALGISIAQCEKSATNSTATSFGGNISNKGLDEVGNSNTSLDDAINKKLSEEAANCTSYIPEKWIQLMREYQPRDKKTHHLHHVPEEYLIACLRREFRQKNDSSPFSMSIGGSISYNIAINEVVSLGFDGIFVTKARSP